MNKSAPPNPREAAYLALLCSLKGTAFIQDELQKWRAEASPKPIDYSLAQEIAYGSARMALALDNLALQCADKKKLGLKLKEKALLRTALYQFRYMKKVPAYAIVNESVQIARKYCHRTFAGFVNALLRNAGAAKLALPQGDSVPALSIRYSYPASFIQELAGDYGIPEMLQALEAGNTAAPTMARVRSRNILQTGLPHGMALVPRVPMPVVRLLDASLVQSAAASPDYYIQNAAPVVLMEHLSLGTQKPAFILDLCASPGGKLLLAHDLYPGARLHANDISEGKLKPLRENLAKFGIHATLTCGLGEIFRAEQKFDLVILDVPCSNTGVLNKRPEARWRLEERNLEELETVQLRLLENAARLLTPNGEIWYMTCSILRRENDRLVKRACQLLGLKVRTQKCLLPNAEGWDGGYGAALLRGCGP